MSVPVVTPPPPSPPPPFAPLRFSEATDDALLSRFLEAIAARGLALYPEQEEAVLELLAGRNVILNTPTGSGKSLVATAAHFFALSRGRRSVYTCPIKALVNEKFLALCRDFGPAHVGMMTGDASVNPDAAILCCTAEILANQALARGDEAGFSTVIMDEFHYYSDPERGVSWQVPLLTLGRSRFLLMSATLGDTSVIEKETERVTGIPVVVVRSERRPVPLEFEWSEVPLSERVEKLILEQQVPAYLVHFTQRAAAETAQALMSLPVCSREEKAALAEALESARFTSPYGRELKRWLRHGIGVHHAGLLPRYRILVEKLAQRGLLKLICGTDTLGVGINVPLRTVVFTQLWKYDGKKSAILTVRDFRQIAGRAGRKGFDDIGRVVVQAPEWTIANLREEAKAAANPLKKKKFQKQSAPEGAVGWERKTLDRLLTAQAEPLVSRFAVSHGMLLLMLSRDADGCRLLRDLISDCHDTPHKKQIHRRRAWQLFRALWERGIVQPADCIGITPGGTSQAGNNLKSFSDPNDCVPRDCKSRIDESAAAGTLAQRPEMSPLAQHGSSLAPVPAKSGDAEQARAPAGHRVRPVSTRRKIQVNVALQDDFSLHQALSLYLIDTVARLDRESPDYALDVLTLCEAIVEDPDVILRAQVSRAKTEKLNELKAQGVPYDERIEKLETVEHPKPLRDFLYDTFNAFAAAHPWIDQENVRPKSIAREMHERFLSFADYVRDYGLERVEGLLLRHLMQVWKVLVQTVPSAAKTEEVHELETLLEALVRGVDSSLLEEWAQLQATPEKTEPASASKRKNNSQPIIDEIALTGGTAASDVQAGDTGSRAGEPEGTARKFGTGPLGLARDPHALKRAVRVAIHLLLQDVASAEWEVAAGRVLPEGASGEMLALEARKLEQAFARYFEARGRFRLDPAGRSAANTHWLDTEAGAPLWRVAQVLADPEELNDWEACLTVNLEEVRATGRAALRFDRVAEIGT
jgi:Domain of unknown function (DUF3516)/DEAD/DEAH box helicase